MPFSVYSPSLKAGSSRELNVENGTSLEEAKPTEQAPLENSAAPAVPPKPLPPEQLEELPEVEESAPPAGGEAIALAEPEEPTALFDVGVSPGEKQQSNKKIVAVVIGAAIGIAAGAAAYLFKIKKYA